jgi:hypothetical protein
MAEGAQHPESVVQPLRDRSRPERAQPSGGELEREWQPIKPGADARHVRRVLLIERKARCRCVRALDEQAHRLVAEELGRISRLIGVRDAQ